MQETPMFTVFTVDGVGYDMYVDRWNVRHGRVFFHRSTWSEPWYDLPARDVVHIQRNR